MGKMHVPRKGSLQFWPRKRAARHVPSVNWNCLNGKKVESKNGLLGFIGYKVGMATVVAKDTTNNSMTKGKTIVVPITLVECPPMKILSVRFYKHGKTATEVLSSTLDKELRRKIKMPKTFKKIEEMEGRLNEFTDLRLVAYSLVKKTQLKKASDIIEIALVGDLKQKFDVAKNLMDKEINVDDVFAKGQLLDVHAVTKGKGLQGPVKRFGLNFKQHKSEKGVRRPGSLGPWHPARVTFRAPQAGQVGFFTRVQYNNKILEVGKEISEIKGEKARREWHNYGFINSPYCLIKGSLIGPQKRALVLTAASRATKTAAKENLEVVELI